MKCEEAEKGCRCFCTASCPLKKKSGWKYISTSALACRAALSREKSLFQASGRGRNAPQREMLANCRAELHQRARAG